MRLLSALVLLAPLACADSEGTFRPEPIDSALAAALASDTGTVVSLDSLGPKAWTALYVIGPYSNAAWIRRCISPSGSLEDYGIAARDDIVALYFKRPNGRLSSMTLPWRGQFAQTAFGREYPQGNARFRVHYDTALRRKHLLPAGALTGSCS